MSGELLFLSACLLVLCIGGIFANSYDAAERRDARRRNGR